MCSLIWFQHGDFEKAHTARAINLLFFLRQVVSVEQPGSCCIFVTKTLSAEVALPAVAFQLQVR